MQFFKNDTFPLRDSYTIGFSRQVLVNLEWHGVSAMECFKLLKWSFSHNVLHSRDSQIYTIVPNKPLTRQKLELAK